MKGIIIGFIVVLFFSCFIEKRGRNLRSNTYTRNCIGTWIVTGKMESGSENSVIEGVVLDALDKKSIEFILINVNDNYKVVSDDSGRFRIEIPEEIRRIQFTSASNDTLNIDSISVKRGQAIEIKIFLGSSVME